MLENNLPRETTKRPYWPQALWLLLILFITWGFGYFILRWSYWHGRLATIPQFDDCGYMMDAGIRYLQLKREGIFSIVTNYPHFFPHTPFSSFMALGGYLIFGVKDYAPYAMNSLVVFLFLIFLNHVLRDKNRWQRLGAFMLALSCPYCGALIAEFRPDLACALMIAVGATIALRSTWTRAPRLRRAFVGVLFGAAMLTKPSTFPQTGFYFVVSMVLGWVLDRRAARNKPGFMEFLKSTLLPITLFVAIALPHFVLTLSYYLYYIYGGMVTQRGVWALQGSLWEHAWYFLGGPGGAFLMGTHLCLFAVLIVEMFVLDWINPFLAERRARYVALAALTVFSYVAPTLNAVKTQYFGAIFFAFVLILGILSLFEIIAVMEKSAQFAAGIVLRLVCLFGVVCFQYPQVYGDRSSADFAARRMTNSELYREIKSRTQRAIDPAKIIFYTSTGIINAVTINLQYIRDGIMPPTYLSANLIYIPEEIPDSLEKADVVVASESNNPEVYNWLPIGQQQGRILDGLRQDRRFREAARVDTSNHNAFIIFDKIPHLASTGEKIDYADIYRTAFEGYTATSGLGVQEGPYSAANLPVVCWGFHPATTLKPNPEFSGPGKLVLVGQCHKAGQTLTIVVGGKEILQHKFDNAFEFERIEAEFDLPPGGEITLKYGFGDLTSNVPRAVLFKEIRLTKK